MLLKSIRLGINPLFYRNWRDPQSLCKGEKIYISITSLSNRIDKTDELRAGIYLLQWICIESAIQVFQKHFSFYFTTFFYLLLLNQPARSADLPDTLVIWYSYPITTPPDLFVSNENIKMWKLSDQPSYIRHFVSELDAMARSWLLPPPAYTWNSKRGLLELTYISAQYSSKQYGKIADAS